jgi:glucokinase
LIGVDFGGTRIKAGVVDGGEVVRTASTETYGAPSAVLDAISTLVKSLEARPSCVGVAIPGECDTSGRCYRMPNVPGFEGVAVATELGRRLGCVVGVENDATTAALGESLFGHGRTYPSFAMVTLGTGVGGGVVIDGHVRRGTHGFGGELGHVAIDRSASAPRCPCGQHGCVEAFAGTNALLSRYQGLGGHCADVLDIARAAKAGDARAALVFDEMGDALGWMLTNVQNVLDLDAIIFSGGISASLHLIEPSLRRTMRARAHAQPLGEIPLLVSALGERAGIVGAAHLTAHPSRSEM